MLCNLKLLLLILLLLMLVPMSLVLSHETTQAYLEILESERDNLNAFP